MYNVTYIFLVEAKEYIKFPDDYELTCKRIRAIDFVKRDDYFELMVDENTVSVIPDSLVMGIAEVMKSK